MRPEQEGDASAIRAIHEAAFGREAEAELVERLRAEATGYVGFVAEEHGEVIGHVAFTPVRIDGADEHPILGLAPAGVLPEQQGRGVGEKLIHDALVACGDRGIEAVVVLGDPDYYVRFGFAPAIEIGLECELDVPAEAFQVLEIAQGGLIGVEGKVRYHPAFADL